MKYHDGNNEASSGYITARFILISFKKIEKPRTVT